MRILIFGAGGVGSLVGGMLARTGHGVSLLGRPWHLDLIRREGLTITGIWGDYRIKAFDLYTDVKEIGDKDFDLIILTVKAYDTEKAVEGLLPLMKEHTMLLSLQNGLGNIETILKKVKPEQFLIGRIITGVEIEPGKVRVTVTADPVAIGAVPGSIPKLAPERMAAALNAAKIPAKAVPDVLTVIWSKVIYNCALNGICTVHEMPYGKILESDETRNWMTDVVRECYAVGHKKGVALDPPSAEAYNELLIHTLIPRTAAHYPSMLQDVRRRRRIEIDALNGAICRLGREFGIPTPANHKIVEEVIKKISDVESC